MCPERRIARRVLGVPLEMGLGSVPLTEDEAIHRLAGGLRGRRIAVLTGAGCSTESGIPDYRGPETRKRARHPVEYARFVASAEARRRYWARAVLAWPRFVQAQPNDAHRALADLERVGAVMAPITQNVDRLHVRAGSPATLELHGALEEVICLSCTRIHAREAIQSLLTARNRGFLSAAGSARLAPDGDSDLPDALVEGFEVVDCPACGGVLKPHVVFFGESVPRERVDRAFRRVDSADALLVLGTSLAVFSGFRFVRRAAARGLPIFVVNLGPTRADAMAALKLEARVGDVGPRVATALFSGPPLPRAPAGQGAAGPSDTP